MDTSGPARLEAWLRDRGIDGRRRIVRQSESAVLVSKFEPGFAARLHEAIDRVPELFDASAISARYQVSNPMTSRVEAWRLAINGVLADLAEARRLDRDQLAEIRAGTDSVAALLDSALWSGPTVGADWTPSESERAAFREALARMDDDSSIFTRYYGDLEGKRVENHCPGSAIARRLFAQAWSLCTET
jgi:hypothetical protein